MVACHGEGFGLGLAGGHPPVFSLVGFGADYDCIVSTGIDSSEGDCIYVFGPDDCFDSDGQVYYVSADLFCTAFHAACGDSPDGQFLGGQGGCATPQTP